MKGPIERTLEELRRQGCRAEVVEKWIPHTRRRKDLFDVIDVVALRGGDTIGVQVTTVDHLAARVKKIEDADALDDLRKAGWTILAWGWRKNAKGRWYYREVDLS